MSTLIKSPNDGRWYYEHTQWKYILDSLCDALECFSEADTTSRVYLAIDKVADEVSNILNDDDI